jgi:DNA mismatch repair protein MSH2
VLLLSSYLLSVILLSSCFTILSALYSLSFISITLLTLLLLLLTFSPSNPSLPLTPHPQDSTVHRNQLRDGPLKSIPNLTNIATKMQKASAGLAELYNLYTFTRSIPKFVETLKDLVATLPQTLEDTGSCQSAEESAVIVATIQTKFLSKLAVISTKFEVFERLVEHVLDFNALPDLQVNAKHDSELQEIAAEQQQLLTRAEEVHRDAVCNWASFAEVKLETRHTTHGICLRTTKGDDATRLQEKNSKVQILQILKNGVYFTTPKLLSLAESYKELQGQYKEKQGVIVEKVIDTAAT